MAINFNRYLEEGTKLGLNPYQVTFSVTNETSISTFNDIIENQQIGNTQSIGAKGLFDGRQGSFSTDAIDKDTSSLLAENVLESAKYGKESNPAYFYAGGKKIRRAKTVSKDFKSASLKELREVALRLYKKAIALDKRINKVEINLGVTEAKTVKANNLGLKATDASKNYVGYISVYGEDDNKEPRSGGLMFSSFTNIEDFEKNGIKVIPLAIREAVDFFGSKAIAGKKYKAVLRYDTVSALMGFFLSQLNEKAIQKHLSVFEGKVGKQIVSKCLTIRHTPHVESLSSASIDADGYPTQDFKVISRGVLENTFVSQETAFEGKKENNGCASSNGNGGPIVLTVNKGKKTVAELLSKMNNGLYITSVSGLNSGINGQTLDFSLPCQGYVVKDGKIDKAVSMIIMSGNLLDLFNSVQALSDESEYSGGIFNPSMLIKKLAISGK